MQPKRPNWFAVVTKPRQEHIALANLERQGFECFLPMALNPYQRRSNRCGPVVEPLFPRYLFLRAVASQQNLAPVRSTRGVVGMVRFGVELAVIPDPVINGLKGRRQGERGLIRIEPVPVKAGDTVRVFDGPLAGIEGIVTERNSENRAFILMEILGRQTRVEVDALLLQKAS
jgi:transcriptional antiterminator RfaH